MEDGRRKGEPPAARRGIMLPEAVPTTGAIHRDFRQDLLIAAAPGPAFLSPSRSACDSADQRELTLA